MITERTVAELQMFKDAQEVVNRVGTGSMAFIAFQVVIIWTLTPERYVEQFEDYKITKEQVVERINIIGLKIDTDSIKFQFIAFGSTFIIKHINDMNI